jgi:hypothetical protein
MSHIAKKVPVDTSFVGLFLALAVAVSPVPGAAAGAVGDPGFEAEGTAGALSTWRDCGTVPAKLESDVAMRGRWALELGNPSGGEIAGDSAVCQQIVVPMARSVMLDYWAKSASTEVDPARAYQQVALYDGGATPDMSQPYAVLVRDTATTRGWAHYTFDITQFSGQTLYLCFAVHGDGDPAAHTSMTIDEVSLQVESPIRADTRS